MFTARSLGVVCRMCWLVVTPMVWFGRCEGGSSLLLLLVAGRFLAFSGVT
jgi:hypothetical protein